MATKLEGSCHCGAVTYTVDGIPKVATACNCTLCRRYGVIWAYDWVDEKIHVSGETKAYQRSDGSGVLDFHFCPHCGCVAFWRSLIAENGRLRIAVNLRLVHDPDAIADIPIDHFDGLDKFRDNERDGCTVRNLWF